MGGREARIGRNATSQRLNQEPFLLLPALPLLLLSPSRAVLEYVALLETPVSGTRQ